MLTGGNLEGEGGGEFSCFKNWFVRIDRDNKRLHFCSLNTFPYCNVTIQNKESNHKKVVNCNLIFLHFFVAFGTINP